jgi:TatD DNase family protein
MLDSHCHLDRYPDAPAVAARANREGVFVIAVTNLPSHFKIGMPHVAKFPRMRLALGLHPLTVLEHPSELEQFEILLGQTSFVGEVGLDFSREGKPTAEQQIQSFRFVADKVAKAPKVISIHSRGAEKEVLRILAEYKVGPAILHWYSGPLSVLRDAVAAGHYFSINPAMTASKSGQDVIASIPKDRLLTESDGPYAKFRGVATNPWDVSVTENYLADKWSIPLEEVRSRIWQNFQRVIEPVRSATPTRTTDAWS